MLYADLDELETMFAGSLLGSARRPAVAWLRRADYSVGAETDLPWAEAVRREATRRLGRPIEGPVRHLTNPRTHGFRLNPVSLYYCFGAPEDGEPPALEAVLTEVTNTPWDERHVYAVDVRRCRRHGGAWEARLGKEHHVSPFLPMEMEYLWRFDEPGERLLFYMENHRDGERVFHATLGLSRRPLDPSQLRRVLLRYPALTLRTFLWIYVNAAILKLRGLRFHPHPKTTDGADADAGSERAARSA
jgi:DUF1365 family protein